MNYIWQHTNWPFFFVNEKAIQSSLNLLKKEEEKTKNAFSILKNDNSLQFRANLIAEGITSSLNIENEKIDIDSVFSSVAKHLFIPNYAKDNSNAYSDNLVEMVSDALENKNPITTKRILNWQKMLFENQAGLSKKTRLGFRQGPEYVLKNAGKDSTIIYEAIPSERVEAEINQLLSYINKSEESNYIIAAISSLWFVLIHPFEDGNGRISRALADYVILKNSKDTLPLVCLSSGILKKRNEYYQLIEKISSQNKSLDITEYVDWFLKIITESFAYSREQLSRALSISSFIGSLSPAEYNSRELHMLYLLASGKFRGKITNEKWVKINKCSNTVAFRDIQHLLNQNILLPSGESGPKTSYFFNEEILQ